MRASPLIAMKRETYSGENGRSAAGTFGTSVAILCITP